MADVTPEECWYCEHDRHQCSACGNPVEHDETFCPTCHPVMFGEEN